MMYLYRLSDQSVFHSPFHILSAGRNPLGQAEPIQNSVTVVQWNYPMPTEIMFDRKPKILIVGIVPMQEMV